MTFRFDDHELALAAELLELRYGRPIALDLAEAEVPVDPSRAAPTACPALIWEARGVQFVVCKLGAGRFRGAAFDATGEGLAATGVLDHEDLGDCVDALLRAKRAGLQ